MKFAPLVSIIINSYNGAKFIKDSINSILNQEYSNWEIIFWDNNSKDQTKKIIDSFKDKRIKYFKNSKYKTLYTSRNLALKKCKGDYISFLDVDDWWDKNKLSAQINLINLNKKIKIIFTNYYIYFEKKKIKKIAFKKNLPNGNITKNILEDYCVGILTVLIKKDILKKNLFNSKYEIISDFDLFTKLSLKYEFFSIQKPLAFYRVHSSNFSKKKINLYISEMQNWVNLNKLFFKKKKIKLTYPLLLIKKLKIKKFIFFLGRVVQW